MQHSTAHLLSGALHVPDLEGWRDHERSTGGGGNRNGALQAEADVVETSEVLLQGNVLAPVLLRKGVAVRCVSEGTNTIRRIVRGEKAKTRRVYRCTAQSRDM